MGKRIKERELILPSLFLMNLSPEGIITTSELISRLREILKPTGEDLEILPGRRDDKFSQKVRNLKAHDTFERYGYAKYLYIDPRGGNFFKITEKGIAHLRDNMDVLQYLLVNDFEWKDLQSGLLSIEKSKDEKRNIEVFDENIVVQEGLKKIIESKVYQRSSKLRSIAIEHYTEDGHILCLACRFDFASFYGEIGAGFIEIHHTKPIFKYADDDLGQTISNALKNVAPVCSNCHRMIHRNRSNILEIGVLVDCVSKNGIFKGIKI